MDAADNAANWFSSYFSDQSQFVDVKKCISSSESVACGVPQGSILGPPPFTLYVNTMANSVTSDLCLYADDSMLVVSWRHVKTIEMTLTNEMESLSNWLISNKLSLHLGKTESILFASKKKLNKVSEININCKGVKSESKSNVLALWLIKICLVKSWQHMYLS